MGFTDREALASGRVSALYLVSLLATASAEVAWRGARPLHLAVHAVGLGVALLLGALLAEALSAVGTAALRRRARLIAYLLVPLPTVFVLAVAWSAPLLAGEAASALALLQVALLLLSEAFGLELLALWGALVLSLVAAAVGGPPAVIGLAGFLALAGLFFSLDHTLKRLAPWPQAPAPALGLVLGDALRALAVPVILLVIALAVLPNPAPAVQGGAGPTVTAPELARAYRWLILVALVGTGSLVLVFRWLRGRRADAPPLVEMPEMHVEAEEILDAPSAEDVRYAAARGQVIRAYLRVLTHAREAGFRLERCLTPREIEGRLRRPETALGVLTALFMDARYGPDDPGPDEIVRAEEAARDICSTLRDRPRAGRRGRAV
jgi:hypothetical protein